MKLFLLCLLAFLLAGCAPKASTDVASPNAAPGTDEMATKFGEAVAAGDWNSAYSLTSSEFRQRTSQFQMQALYDQLARQILQDEPSYKANKVEIYAGELPRDRDEAHSEGLTGLPFEDKWRSWHSVSIGNAPDGKTIERGIDASVFIIDENGQLKIGFVEFSFMD